MSCTALSPAPPSTRVPKIATIRAPPSERKKFIEAVAMPSCCGATAFWTTIVESGSTVPIPIESSTNRISVNQSGSSGPMKASSPQAQTLSVSSARGRRL